MGQNDGLLLCGVVPPLARRAHSRSAALRSWLRYRRRGRAEVERRRREMLSKEVGDELTECLARRRWKDGLRREPDVLV